MSTLLNLFDAAVASKPTAPALHVWHDDTFTPITWRQLADDVFRWAALLEKSGIGPGDRVLHVGENRYEWILLDLAIHARAAVHVAAHTSLSAKQIAAQASDCGAKLAVIASDELAAQLTSPHAPLTIPILRHNQIAVAAAELPNALDRGESLFANACSQVIRDTLATILYTSGTTGEPKGVMLSHGNLASNALACVQSFENASEQLRLCWLPLSHIYARTADLYTWLASASQMALARSRETIITDCSLVRPTFINGVPYFYDKLAAYLHDSGRLDEPGALHGLLGGQIRTCCAGGAALSDATARTFERQKVLLVQGYGLTETSPVISTCTKQHQRIGTVGPPLPGVEVAIADDGEILTRGPHVMLGYWNQPAATAEVLRDGWLYTGDLGVMEDGYLRITGRKKEIIALASGKKVAPALVERLLCEDPLIAQAAVFGESQKYLVALIVPEVSRWQALAQQRGNTDGISSSIADLLTADWVRATLRQRIDRRLADLADCEQVGPFALLDRPFSIEQGEMTVTLKLRRGIIARHFAETIASLYTSPAVGQ